MRRQLSTAALGGFLFLGVSMGAAQAKEQARDFPWCVATGMSYDDCMYANVSQCQAAALGIGSCFQKSAATPVKTTRTSRRATG